MKKILWLCLLGAACGGPETPTQPFIEMTLLSPEGFIAPKMDRLEVTTSAIINGSPISNTNEADLKKDVLPTDFVVLFSEPVRGSVVDFDVHGFFGGVDVFSAKTSVVADIASVEVIVSFCGDEVTDPNRNEGCDDGANNANNIPNACPTPRQKILSMRPQ
jgi:hypothetical protein